MPRAEPHVAPPSRRGFVLLLGACMTSAATTGAAAATAALLKPAWPPTPAAAPALGADGRVFTLSLGEVIDQRPGAPGRRLGAVRAAVFGIHGSELALDGEAATVLGAALRDRLAVQGITLAAAGATADLRLDTTLQALTLNVAARDDRHIAVQAALRRVVDGRVLWSGTVEDRDERFAGVSGNSRADLETYLGGGIAKVVDQLGTQVRQAQSALAAAARPASAAPQLASPPAAAPPAQQGTGAVLVTSLPTRVKVYVGDVYHGLTPIALELPVGVSTLHFKLDGYRNISEKVAVRRGATVELELKLER